MDVRNLQGGQTRLFWVLWQHQKSRVASVRFFSRRYRAEISAMRPKTKNFGFIKLWFYLRCRVNLKRGSMSVTNRTAANCEPHNRTAANREPETNRKSAPQKKREPQFEVQFELQTPATHYDNIAPTKDGCSRVYLREFVENSRHPKTPARGREGSNCSSCHHFGGIRGIRAIRGIWGIRG